ncbi:MAG: DUF547 domain-containing protein [Desulfohalobiaceae bacterium]|nr:DUF547 domain-containing protein [Desulfohalobiaceae bacterium]
MKTYRLACLNLLLAVFLPCLALAAPKADLWERWQTHAPGSNLQADHRPWTRFLEKYLSVGPNGINRLDYRGVTPKDRNLLDEYLEELASIPVSRLSRAIQLPFWINLYNALTVKVVLDHYPVGSIKDIDISPGLFSSGPWDKKLISIEGEEISLNAIEHRILRPIWQDPRIHYAVNCTSLSCPNLQPKAYTEENTEIFFEKGATEYINHPRGVTIENDELVISSIYKWYQEDFGNSEAGVIEHLLNYARPDLKIRLQTFQDIDDYHYDWSLNQTQ